MELDELKHTWQAIDRNLQQRPLTDEAQLVKLIEAYKARTRSSLGKLKGVQRFSIGIGVAVMILAMAGIVWIGPAEREMSARLYLLLMLAISVAGGSWWDWKVYRWMKSIRIDEMSIAEVGRRVLKLRRWINGEVVVVSVWVLLFNVLTYVLQGHYQAPWQTQVIPIVLTLVLNVIFIYAFYRIFIYKHLNNINKHLKELKELCKESS